MPPKRSRNAGRTIRRSWDQLAGEFIDCHRSGLNVSLHLVTTPLGLYAMLTLAALASPVLPLGIVCFYLLILLGRVPAREWLASAIVLAGMLALAITWPGTLWTSVVALVAAYVMQEVAHIVSGERTLQSTYMHANRWPITLAQHTLLLLPLVLHAAFCLRASLLSFLVARNTVLLERLDSQQAAADLELLRRFVEEQHPSLDHSSHWWQQKLDPTHEAACRRLAESPTIGRMFRDLFGPDYAVEPLFGMNEIYVTGPSQAMTSDTVFYTPHIDGPWAVFPFAAVFRSMVAITPNTHVATHFPLNGLEYDRPESYALTEPEVLAFDYNREPHYITSRPADEGAPRRINLKLHYVVYPNRLRPYGRLLGRLTTWYNTRARRLFLDTIAPDSWFAKLQATLIVWTTRAFEFIVRRVGWSNLAYVVAVALGSAMLGRPVFFLIATSFVHYGMYLGTFAERGRVAFGRFVRNVNVFKTISLAQLAACYVYYFEFHAVSLLLVVGGFGLAALAYRALGRERTFFAAELGFVPHERVRVFPYNLLPHPMILGSLIGLCGIELLAPLREALPWLVPTHIGCYLLHLWQELRSRDRQTVEQRAPSLLLRLDKAEQPPIADRVESLYARESSPLVG